MIEARTVPAKYIFLDVVGFTHNRSVEAQSDIVHILNGIAKSAITEQGIPNETLILLPTGDGLCIAVLNVETPYDVHIQIALSLIKGVHEHNESTDDEMRRFQVRLGLNSNIDNLVTDINGKQNIAGAGINMAARVMSMADGNQILVGESVYDTLRYREKYMSSFKAFQATVKHGHRLPVYQFIGSDTAGLNLDTPQAFQLPQKVELRLTKVMGYYFAHAIKNRPFFIQRKGYSEENPTVILLWFLAQDSEANSNATEISIPHLQAYKAAEGTTLAQQFEYYDSIDYSVISSLASSIRSEKLYKYNQYFESSTEMNYCFVNSAGIEKLRFDYPAIWKEFDLDKYV